MGSFTWQPRLLPFIDGLFVKASSSVPVRFVFFPFFPSPCLVSCRQSQVLVLLCMIGVFLSSFPFPHGNGTFPPGPYFFFQIRPYFRYFSTYWSFDGLLFLLLRDINSIPDFLRPTQFGTQSPFKHFQPLSRAAPFFFPRSGFPGVFSRGPKALRPLPPL